MFFGLDNGFGFRYSDKSMFQLGFGEILLLGLVAVLVIPPEKLPKVAQKLGRFLHQLKSSVKTVQGHLEKANPSHLDSVLEDQPASSKKTDSTEIKKSEKNSAHKSGENSDFAHVQTFESQVVASGDSVEQSQNLAKPSLKNDENS